MFVGAGQGVRGAEQLPVAFADTHPFQGEQRPAEQGAEFGQDAGDLRPGADGDDHHRDVGVSAEEPGAFPVAVRGAVNSEQCGGAGDAAAVQQVADRDEGGHPVDPLLTPDVHGQLGGLVELLGQADAVGRHRSAIGPVPE